MNPRENVSRSKEVLGAYFRQGLHELGAAFYGGGTAAQHSEYGMIGTRTPGQVADGLRAAGHEVFLPQAEEPPAPTPTALYENNLRGIRNAEVVVATQNAAVLPSCALSGSSASGWVGASRASPSPSSLAATSTS